MKVEVKGESEPATTGEEKWRRLEGLVKGEGQVDGEGGGGSEAEVEDRKALGKVKHHEVCSDSQERSLSWLFGERRDRGKGGSSVRLRQATFTHLSLGGLDDDEVARRQCLDKFLQSLADNA
ncbi:predicted protein [Histoplasma capsulatum var. duboisii H88]|uniref:Predicted protein n=1 Tax=Ajellomyces capsulatus (strain H88) TaxID=544711 RepID=F0UCB3_AJEC8|nr:predicted protein [Histoplasma capsulatum var. duboisii H88]